jgi:hypothetical protein
MGDDTASRTGWGVVLGAKRPNLEVWQEALKNHLIRSTRGWWRRRTSWSFVQSCSTARPRKAAAAYKLFEPRLVFAILLGLPMMEVEIWLAAVVAVAVLGTTNVALSQFDAVISEGREATVFTDAARWDD